MSVARSGLTVALIAVVLTGCGAAAVDTARRALEQTARVSAEIDSELADQRREVSAAVIADASATREDYARAMAPFDEALQVTEALRQAELAAEAGIDAAQAGRESRWPQLVSCVLAALSQLVGIAAQRISLPDAAGELLSSLAALSDAACASEGSAP